MAFVEHVDILENSVLQKSWSLIDRYGIKRNTGCAAALVDIAFLHREMLLWISAQRRVTVDFIQS
jgi:hypothetical protein